jgi:hypothetical protein
LRVRRVDRELLCVRRLSTKAGDVGDVSLADAD